MPDRSARNRLTRRLQVFGPAVIVLLTGTLSLAALRHAIETRELVVHTRDVLDAASSLFTAMLEAETAQRGYVISRDSTLLESYERAAGSADADIRKLRQLTRDNPAQQARVDSLALSARRRLELSDSSIELGRQGKFGEASALVARLPGRALVADIRRRIQEIERSEEILLSGREQSEQQATLLAALLLAAGTVLAGALAFVVNSNFDRALDERRAALGNAEVANEQLKSQALALEAQATAAKSAAAEAAAATNRAVVAQQAAEESERRTERLQAATEAFGGALSLSDVATLVVRQAAEALSAESGVLAAMTPQGDSLELIAVSNVSVSRIGQRIPLAADFPLCEAVKADAPVLLATREDIARRFPRIVDAHSADGVQSIAAFPLRSNGHVLGALLLRWTSPRPLAALDVSFMVALSRIATEAFERARLFDAEREARTAAESANRAKAAFLASMSHELRTPLQAALGFAQLVRSGMYGPVNERQMEALSRVERSQTHLASLIDDILDFARLEAGRVRVERESVRVADVIGDLQPLVEPQAVEKAVQLTLERPDPELRVVADRQRLCQVLVNLVGNAIKFTPAGGRIRVAAMPHPRFVTIQVRDTGTGIPANRLAAIFEPFVQVDTALTRTQSGAGLGLSISRDLARAMGGDVTVDSEIGRGSTFSVVLPVASD